MLRNNEAFTLMEILVVVTIIGILAAIAVPSYIHAVDKGRREACAVNVKILFSQVERYNLVTGQRVPVDTGLVAFLQEAGYLTGEEPKCPYSGPSYNPAYKLVYEEGNQAVVYCTHCDSEGKDLP